MTRTCMLDQQAADNPGGCPEEVRPVLPIHSFLIDKTNVDIVNQSGGLKGMPSVLGTHVPSGHPSKFLINERSEEHTSELQSLAYLVCRLLLEKKKKTTHDTEPPASHFTRAPPTSVDHHSQPHTTSSAQMYYHFDALGLVSNRS